MSAKRPFWTRGTAVGYSCTAVGKRWKVEVGLDVQGQELRI